MTGPGCVTWSQMSNTIGVCHVFLCRSTYNCDSSGCRKYVAEGGPFNDARIAHFASSQPAGIESANIELPSEAQDLADHTRERLTLASNTLQRVLQKSFEPYAELLNEKLSCFLVLLLRSACPGAFSPRY